MVTLEPRPPEMGGTILPTASGILKTRKRARDSVDSQIEKVKKCTSTPKWKKRRDYTIEQVLRGMLLMVKGVSVRKAEG